MTEAVVEVIAEVVPFESAAGRKLRAEDLNRQALALRDVLHEKWFEFSKILYPIFSDKLYTELGFRTWTDYIDATLRLPVTTVGNWLMPMRKLLEAGVDPEVARLVPLNRVGDLAMIARANEGRLDPELIEQAISAKTRGETQAYRAVVDAEKTRLGIEPLREIKLLVTESLYDFFREVTKLVAQLDQEELQKRHEVETLERGLVALLQTEEFEQLMQEQPVTEAE